MRERESCGALHRDCTMNTMMHLLSDLLRTFAKPPEMPEAAMSEHEKF